MPRLAELQAAMAAAILEPAAALPAAIRDEAIPAAERLAIHRGTTFGGLTEALKDAFPVVALLVGEAFFAMTARQFIRQHPPQAPCLAAYGAALPDFLAGFAPARALAYLPDVARLEWAVHEAYHAPDAPALDPARIAALPPAAHGTLCLLPHPAARLVTSGFPVDRIWQAHHGDGDLADIDPARPAACRLLVDRHADGIRMLSLGRGECALLAALFAGETLDGACGLALATEADLDLATVLARHLSRGSFAGAG